MTSHRVILHEMDRSRSEPRKREREETLLLRTLYSSRGSQRAVRKRTVFLITNLRSQESVFGK